MPGATTSGFRRPSAVGPREEKSASWSFFLEREREREKEGRKCQRKKERARRISHKRLHAKIKTTVPETPPFFTLL